tara:strand:- start:100 stop:276 length:177 start_codon:yes stop_codon:yes gene_type:complete
VAARYNKEFKLNPKDIELIENALVKYPSDDRSEITKLLAKLYHQKVWYRPEDETYISG